MALCSPADAVFLDDETERQECVMNEIGIIYHGAFDDIAERDWNYGQVAKTIDEQQARVTCFFLFKILKTSFFSSTVQLRHSGCMPVHHGQVWDAHHQQGGPRQGGQTSLSYGGLKKSPNGHPVQRLHSDTVINAGFCLLVEIS